MKSNLKKKIIKQTKQGSQLENILVEVSKMISFEEFLELYSEAYEATDSYNVPNYKVVTQSSEVGKFLMNVNNSLFFDYVRKAQLENLITIPSSEEFLKVKDYTFTKEGGIRDEDKYSFMREVIESSIELPSPSPHLPIYIDRFKKKQHTEKWINRRSWIAIVISIIVAIFNIVDKLFL